jgi:hypothetical protein
MTFQSIQLKDMAKLSSDEQTSRIASMVAGRNAEPNGEAEFLNSAIASYEERGGMRSDEMRSKLRDGQIRETSEICGWLMLLDARDSLQ